MPGGPGDHRDHRAARHFRDRVIVGKDDHASLKGLRLI
jgi:hypothetical protein